MSDVTQKLTELLDKFNPETKSWKIGTDIEVPRTEFIVDGIAHYPLSVRERAFGLGLVIFTSRFKNKEVVIVQTKESYERDFENSGILL